MLDIESELLAADEKFISLADLSVAVIELSPSNYSAVANWLLWKLKMIDNDRNLPRLMAMNHFREMIPLNSWESDIDIAAAMLLEMKKNNSLPFCHPEGKESGGYWEDSDFFNIGFDRAEIAEVLPDDLGKYIHRKDKIKKQNSLLLDGFDEKTPTPQPESEPDFRGRDTLLEIIAGQATCIGKISGKHIRATGINKSALAKDVYDALCDFGKGMSIDPDQCRKIIGEALKLKTSLNMDYMNLEGERQFAQDQE